MSIVNNGTYRQFTAADVDIYDFGKRKDGDDNNEIRMFAFGVWDGASIVMMISPDGTYWCPIDIYSGVNTLPGIDCRLGADGTVAMQVIHQCHIGYQLLGATANTSIKVWSV